jgi:excisionase family DNA binding protein
MAQTYRLLTPKQVATMLGVSVDWVQDHALRREPRIAHIRIGKHLRFTLEQVQDFIHHQSVRFGS